MADKWIHPDGFYYFKDSKGTVISCSFDPSLGVGRTMIPPDDPDLVRKREERAKTQYQRDRQYPALGEQMDMLFHDMTVGKGSKTGEWYKAVAKVKSDNPKE